jgi:hypothetical protein
MKKLLLSLGVAFLATGAYAQSHDDHKGHNHASPAPTASPAAVRPANASPAAAAPQKASSLKPENMVFSTESHDFGTVAEGPAANYEFEFKNTGKEPLLIETVHASCGCTTPSYSKEPIAPGKSGVIKASYNTVGRPGAFTKSITVTSNAGTKVLTIKGNVEKAPTSSVPENNSMIKTN